MKTLGYLTQGLKIRRLDRLLQVMSNPLVVGLFSKIITKLKQL